MITTFGLLLFAVFLFLSVLHFYWGLGGTWGSEAVIPVKPNRQKVFVPGLAACFTVAGLLLITGFFVLVRAGFAYYILPLWLKNYGLYIPAALFIVRAVGDFKYVGFFKRIRGTLFARMDTLYYSPLCLVVGSLLAIMELAG